MPTAPPPRTPASDDSLTIGALMFLASALCTFLAITHAVLPQVAEVLGLPSSLLTLGGLCLIVFGARDERPLRHAPAAELLLLVGAIAAVAQALLVMAPQPDGLALVPCVGLVGGGSVAAATFQLILRNRGRATTLSTLTLTGLSLIGVGAVAANISWALHLTPITAGALSYQQAAVAVTAVGEVLLSAALLRRRARRREVPTTVETSQKEQDDTASQ